MLFLEELLLMNRIFLILLLIVSQIIFAERKIVNLEIDIDNIILPDSISVPIYSFGISDEWIKVNIDDTLVLIVRNADSIKHNLHLGEFNLNLVPNQTDTITYSKSEVSIDFLADSDFEFLGLKLAIISCISTNNNFYWTLNSIDTSFNNNFNLSNSLKQKFFNPKYFLINRKWGKSINEDYNVRIQGNIYDSIFIFISNLGRSAHSLHFHGYHAKILHSSKFPNHLGRTKDTFPIYSNEYLILLLIPDKLGEYPVHDHNLIATTGGREYGNGMFTTILIND